MSRPKKSEIRLICGTHAATAQRYIIVRKELELVIGKVHRIGCWLSAAETVRATGLCKTLALAGRSLMHLAAQLHDCLETEFASLEKAVEALKSTDKPGRPRPDQRRCPP